MDRRAFLLTVAAATGSAALRADEAESAPLHLATNVYPWRTFYGREGRDFRRELPKVIEEVKAAGLDGFEPAVDSPDELDALAPLLREHGLKMRSLYANTV